MGGRGSWLRAGRGMGLLEGVRLGEGGGRVGIVMG